MLPGAEDLVAPLAKAAVAVGADGVLIDVHPVSPLRHWSTERKRSCPQSSKHSLPI